MSKQAIDVLVLTVVSTGALIANRFVTAAGGQTGENGNALGVARSKADAAGAAVPVTYLGTAVVEAGAAVGEDVTVASDASGRAVATDGTTYTTALGRSLEAASAAGEFIEVALIAN